MSGPDAVQTTGTVATPRPEAWLRGPVNGVPPLLMPVAHALIQAGEELQEAVEGLSVEETWTRPGGAASIAFHLRHVVGSLDRLLTYARGEQLDPTQRDALRREREVRVPAATASELAAQVDGAIVRAIAVLRHTADASLLEPRAVGRLRLPTTVLGLLSHAADHTRRHTGQVIATARILRGTRPS